MITARAHHFKEAADEVVRPVLELALALWAAGARSHPSCTWDLETMNFLHELGEIAAAGGDIRARVFA